MLEPKDIQINGINFIIHKFPAIEGREIVSTYPLSAIPKIGDYKTNESVMFKLMKYVSVRVGDVQVSLTTPQLIDSHTKNWENLTRLEIAVMEYNCSFFQKGLLSTLFQDLVQKFPAWISKILMDSLEPLLQKEKPPISS